MKYSKKQDQYKLWSSNLDELQKDKIYRDADNNPPSYNVKHLSDHMDMINLMTYDIHGHWEDKTGHHALAHTKLSDDRLGGIFLLLP